MDAARRAQNDVLEAQCELVQTWLDSDDGHNGTEAQYKERLHATRARA